MRVSDVVEPQEGKNGKEAGGGGGVREGKGEDMRVSRSKNGGARGSRSACSCTGRDPSRCGRGKLGEARCSISGWDAGRDSQANRRQTRSLDTLTPWRREGNKASGYPGCFPDDVYPKTCQGDSRNVEEKVYCVMGEHGG